MRGATVYRDFVVSHYGISIHAPHARSDKYLTSKGQTFAPDFNPRSSCEERRRTLTLHLSFSGFQSTLLMRGATRKPLPRLLSTLYFNPRSSCEERPEVTRLNLENCVFQSTLLMRGATVSILGIDLPDFIIYFSRTYPFSPKMPTSRHLSCKLHFLCDGTSHFGDL